MSLSFLVRSYFDKEIKREINEVMGQGPNAVDANRLDDTVNTIFNRCHWKAGFGESVKKAAIKDLLKEALVERRATTFPELIRDAEQTMRKKNIQLPLTPSAADTMIEELHKRHPEFRSKDIHYLLRNFSAIESFYMKSGLISKSATGTLQKVDQPNQKTLKSGYLQIHNAVNKNHQVNKANFQGLVHRLSEQTGKEEADIYQSIYENIGTLDSSLNPTGLTAR